MQSNRTLKITTSPHLSAGHSVHRIMRNVVYALMPVVFFAVYAFGLTAVLTLTTALITCLMTEHLLCKISRKNTTINDWSVAITGIIYGLTLPPGLPLWMVIAGGVIAVTLGKFLFGGLGYNPFNPALVGRVFLQGAFPTSMTSWQPAFTEQRFFQLPDSVIAPPFMSAHYDAVSTATPLSLIKFDHQTTPITDLLMGTTAGSMGETCALVIFAGGLYLIARNMMNWRIPAGIFMAVIIISATAHFYDSVHPSPLFMLFSGGLMLGAMFMATDMVASPITHRGCWVYGLLIGSLIMVIRLFGAMPEGVMYAILIANAFAPHIDRLMQPIPFGRRHKP